MGSQKGVPETRSVREETVSIEIMVTSSHFNCKMIKPCHQCCTALKFLKSMYHNGKFIMEVFIDKAVGSFVAAVRKGLKPRWHVRINIIGDSSLDFIKNL